MGKFNFGVSSEAIDSNLDSFYTGDKPPKGIYACEVKQVKLSKNRNDEPMLKILLEIKEKDKAKSKFNGYPIWQNLNVTDQGMPWVNNFLDGTGCDRKKFGAGDVTISGKQEDVSKESPADVLKIGTRKVVGQLVKVNTDDDSYNDQTRLIVKQYLVGDASDPTSEDDNDDTAAEEEADGLADTEDETADEGDGEESEWYTEEELDEMGPADLKAVCDEWEITYAPKATKPTLIKAILKFQDEQQEGAGEEEAADETAEEGEDDEESADLTEEELEEMNAKDLVEYIEAQGWKVPAKKVPSLLRKAILKYQAEPPF